MMDVSAGKLALATGLQKLSYMINVSLGKVRG